MRMAKVALRDALAADGAVAALVPGSQVFSCERAVIPTLPAVELIGVTSERQANALVRHEIQVEITVSHATEDGADLALDAIVQAIRRRLSAAENSIEPIRLAGGGNVLVELQGSRWSVSAKDQASVVRGASVSVTAEVGE